MPLFKIISNTELTDKEDFIAKASAAVAAALGKTEKFVMVIHSHQPDMIFSGSADPAMFVELKSIGLPKNKTAEISSELMGFLQQETGVLPQRIFIEFTDVQREMWGWNSGTI